MMLAADGNCQSLPENLFYLKRWEIFSPLNLLKKIIKSLLTFCYYGYIINLVLNNTYVPVAQLDRATPFKKIGAFIGKQEPIKWTTLYR